MKSTAPLAYAVSVACGCDLTEAVTKMIGVSAVWPRSRISLAVS